MANVPWSSLEIEDLAFERIDSERFDVQFDLNLEAREQDGGLVLSWLYNGNLFDGWRMEQMARH